MATYFVFSDEAGQYGSKRTPGAQSYFVRSATYFNSAYWRDIRTKLDQIKNDTCLRQSIELKWSYIWSLRKHERDGKNIDPKKPYYLFKDVTVPTLLDYVKAVLTLLKNYTDSGVILTVTLNEHTSRFPEEQIYKWHLQDLVQRIEMQMQSQDNLAIIFFDEGHKPTEKFLREHYSTLYTTGDFIKEYRHIKDSLCFEVSRHSFGIQMADYIAGIFNGFLMGYNESKSLFTECVMPLVRRSSTTGQILGYGVMEIPTDETNRRILEQKFSESYLSGQPDDIDDMPF
jgi:hypothetical protein